MRTSATVEQVLAIVRREISDGKQSENEEVQRKAAYLENVLNFYELGRSGAIPDTWAAFARQAEREADSDWNTYQRLKKKFE